MERILKEFCEKHDLKPLKIMVTGPTSKELIKYSKMVGKHYRIPYVRIDDILSNAPDLKCDAESSESDWLAEDYEEDKDEINQYLKNGVLLPNIQIKKEEDEV